MNFDSESKFSVSTAQIVIPLKYKGKLEQF